MSPLEAAVWAFLKERFAGKENAAPISDWDFCDTVAHLVAIYKKPICTTPPSGYFVAKTEVEKKEALNYPDSVLTEVGDHRRALPKPIRSSDKRGFFDRRPIHIRRALF